MKKILLAISVIVLGTSLGFAQHGAEGTADYTILVDKKVETVVNNDSIKKANKERYQKIIADYYRKRNESAYKGGFEKMKGVPYTWGVSAVSVNTKPKTKTEEEKRREKEIREAYKKYFEQRK